MTESSYDSDMSVDTRELVEQGLAISHRNCGSRAEQPLDVRVMAPTRNMDISNVRYPPTSSVSAATTSTQETAPVACESVVGASRNNSVAFITLRH